MNTTDINTITITVEDTTDAIARAGIRVWMREGKVRIYCPKQGGYMVLRRVSATNKDGAHVSYLEPKVADGKVSGAFAASVRQVCEKLANI